jgi:hypothetical protein
MKKNKPKPKVFNSFEDMAQAIKLPNPPRGQYILDHEGKPVWDESKGLYHQLN